ncbi:MAG: CRISPR-associated endonuclease Cas1, partial [Bacteroidota bacterium]
MQLVLDTRDLRISRERGVFLIEPPKGKARRISPKKLSSIAITARVWLGADAVMLAIDNQLPILFFDRIGKAKGRLWSPYFESIATLRRQQIRFQEGPEATRWMVELFELKTIHQIQVLRYLLRRR